MTVYINSKETATAATNLAELMAELYPDKKGVAVAVCDRVVTRPRWAETPLTPEMQIVVIEAAYGG